MDILLGIKLHIFIIAYFLFISLVPGSPSYYRFLVDTVGTLVSLLSLGFLELYLNSRPLNQKNILNSQLHLVVYFQIAFTTREWMASLAGSMFHKTTMLMLNSYPGVLMALLDPRHYSIGLVVTYCTMSVSNLIMVISPVTFHKISSSKGFWSSLLVALLVPLVERILNLIQCGDFTTEVTDPFYHALMIRDELGMTNFVFGKFSGNATVFHGDSSTYEKETKKCAYFPTLVFVIFVKVTLDMIKLIIFVIKETRKLSTEINKSNSLRNLQNNVNNENHGITNSLHHPQPERATLEVVLNPGDLQRDNVNSAQGDEIIAAFTVQTNASTEDGTSIVDLTLPTSDMKSAAFENPAVSTSRSATASEINAASAKEEEIRDTSLSGAIKNTLKLILFRSGTFSLIGFIMCIVTLVPINVYINDKDLPFFPQLLISVARYFAFFLPLAWISFDRDIRVHSLLKLRNMWQRHFI